MKKIFILIISIIMVLLTICGCKNTEKTQETTVANISYDLENPQNDLLNGKLELSNIFEDENYFVAYIDKKVYLENRKTKKITSSNIDAPNGILFVDNGIFYNNDNKILKMDFNDFAVTTLYSFKESDNINSYSPIGASEIGNGNLMISSESGDFVYNPITKIKYSVNDEKAYKGTDYYVVLGDTCRIYYDSKYFETDYAYDCCIINDSLYYWGNLNDNEMPLLQFSKKMQEEKTVVTYKLKDNNGVYSEIPKALYSYNNKLYMGVAINSKVSSSSSYEKYELRQINLKGDIEKKYTFEFIPDSSTFCFYNNYFYYKDTSSNLHYFEL